MNFTIRDVARADVLQQFQYYLVEKGTEVVAERFLDAVQHAIEEVCRRPEMGSPKGLRNPALQGLRTWPIAGFPAMRIYYVYQDSLVRVLRVLHGKRDLDPMLEDDDGRGCT